MRFPEDVRPWGRMWMLFRTKRVWIKLIHVNRGECTSLQYHNKRSELHVDLDRWKMKLVHCGDIHSMHHGRYLEIAWGLPDEADIVRLTDKYRRT